MIPPDDEIGDDTEDAVEDAGVEDERADDERVEDEGAEDEGAEDQGSDDADEGTDTRETGYLWTFDEQEERLPDEFATHMEILDEMEAGEILDLDLARADDYLLWAAAQSLEEQGWISQAIDFLKRIDATTAPHAALSYAEIRLRLHDLLRERGDYEEALRILERVERDDPERAEACRDRRAEVLVLTGRTEEGLRLFEKAARAIPDDPWVPLTAAWALIRAGDYDGVPGWIARAERAARRLEDEQEIRAVDIEVERLENEARIRRERQRRAAALQAAAPRGGTAPGDPEAARQAILGELDAEEVRLTRTPPRTDEERSSAVARLADLHRRASAAWDDAVERHDETAIAAFDDLQWEVVEVAERFGLQIPGVER